ncbi:type 1 glutamine amidotransferase [Parafrigoribacterium soli]|uniref:type 1 glutamine amidotransferase n=1 Tax=Parafrigoribacterium soli TaxID=3144663 RepID=UPI0032EE339D
MRALFVMHDHLSPTGPVSEHLRGRGFAVDEILVVDEANFHTPNVPFAFPDAAEYDLIVPMGAPWGAWDDDRIGHWLLPEIAWVRDAVIGDIPVLGICFGGQLMARALGGTVARARRPEIGWTAIHSDDTSIVPSGPWFQFHYDSWTVPAGASELARNSTASQAFVYGRSLALQFHPELTPSGLEGWLNESGRQQVRDDGQDPDALLEHTRAEEGAAAARTVALLDAYLERIARL